MRGQHEGETWRALAMRACRQMLVALGGVATLASRAAATSCIVPTVAEEAQYADAVFLGRPVGYRPSFLNPLSETVVTFEVTRVWKGSREGRVSVATEGVSLPFVRREWRTSFGRDTSYLVFAQHDGHMLSTGICSGPMPTVYPDSAVQAHIDSRMRELHRDLGAGVPAMAAVFPTTDDLVWLTVGGAVAAALWVRRWKRRRGAS